MKILNVGLISLLLIASTSVRADDINPKDFGFENAQSMTSYALGVQTARTLMKDEVPMDMDQFIKGIKDQTGKKKIAIQEEALRKILNDFQTDLRRTMKNKYAVTAATNLRKGQEFLTANKSKPGVVTLEDGLQYKVIKEGNGTHPSDTDSVTCAYKGTLTNGTQFDASPEGASITMRVDQVVPGFKEALKLMSVGAKWQVFLPSALAYGPRSVGSDIGPNEALVFEIELISINSEKSAQP